MKNLRGVLGALLIVFVFQFTFISCSDDSKIIKNKDSEAQFQKIDKDDEPSRDGNN